MTAEITPVTITNAIRQGHTDVFALARAFAVPHTNYQLRSMLAAMIRTGFLDRSDSGRKLSDGRTIYRLGLTHPEAYPDGEAIRNDQLAGGYVPLAGGAIPDQITRRGVEPPPAGAAPGETPSVADDRGQAHRPTPAAAPAGAPPGAPVPQPAAQGPGDSSPADPELDPLWSAYLAAAATADAHRNDPGCYHCRNDLACQTLWGLLDERDAAYRRGQAVVWRRQIQAYTDEVFPRPAGAEPGPTPVPDTTTQADTRGRRYDKVSDADLREMFATSASLAEMSELRGEIARRADSARGYHPNVRHEPAGVDPAASPAATLSTAEVHAALDGPAGQPPADSTRPDTGAGGGYMMDIAGRLHQPGACPARGTTGCDGCSPIGPDEVWRRGVTDGHWHGHGYSADTTLAGSQYGMQYLAGLRQGRLEAAANQHYGAAGVEAVRRGYTDGPDSIGDENRAAPAEYSPEMQDVYLGARNNGRNDAVDFASRGHPDLPFEAPEPGPDAGHIIDDTGVRRATHADQMAALQAAHQELQADLNPPAPPATRDSGLREVDLNDQRTTPAERKRILDNRALTLASQDPGNNHLSDIAEEVRENRDRIAERNEWATRQAADMTPLTAPDAVDRITHANTPEEIALVASRLTGHDLHRAAQVLGISSAQRAANPNEQEVRDMMADELGSEMAIWGGGRGERLWGSKIRANERALTRDGIDWRAPAPEAPNYDAAGWAPDMDQPDRPAVPDQLEPLVDWQGNQPNPVRYRYDPDAGKAYMSGDPAVNGGAEVELRDGGPSAVAAQLLHMRARIPTSPDHGVTSDQARNLINGMSVDQLKQVAAAVGSPANYSLRTRRALIHHIEQVTVGALLASYAINPRWGRRQDPNF